MTSTITLTILTGFLGAGKTTLLNHILHSDHGLRVAVLVNDFGAINIDTQLVVGVEGETVSLTNGCICCTIRDDLLNATRQLLARPDPPEYILVETSGVSDPVSVAVTFMLPELREQIQLDSIVTIMDAEQTRDLSGTQAILAMDQIAAADLVVLNKVDLVEPSELAAVRAWVREIVPDARLLEATHGQVPLELVLGVGRFAPERLASRPPRAVHTHAARGPEPDSEHAHQPEHAPDHAHTDHTLVFETWSYTSDRPFNFKALREAVRTLPTTIYRAKGVLFVADNLTRRAVLQVVGRRARLTFSELWEDTPPHSQLVVIGAGGGVDAPALRARFEACLAENVPPPTPLTAALEWVRSLVTTG